MGEGPGRRRGPLSRATALPGVPGRIDPRRRVVTATLRPGRGGVPGPARADRVEPLRAAHRRDGPPLDPGRSCGGEAARAPARRHRLRPGPRQPARAGAQHVRARGPRRPHAGRSGPRGVELRRLRRAHAGGDPPHGARMDDLQRRLSRRREPRPGRCTRGPRDRPGCGPPGAPSRSSPTATSSACSSPAGSGCPRPTGVTSCSTRPP